jgi:hypothetical protein
MYEEEISGVGRGHTEETEDNIYINLEERGWNCEDWINLAQDWNKRPVVVNSATKLRKCWGFIYLGSISS